MPLHFATMRFNCFILVLGVTFLTISSFAGALPLSDHDPAIISRTSTVSPGSNGYANYDSLYEGKTFETRDTTDGQFKLRSLKSKLNDMKSKFKSSPASVQPQSPPAEVSFTGTGASQAHMIHVVSEALEKTVDQVNSKWFASSGGIILPATYANIPRNAEKKEGDKDVIPFEIRVPPGSGQAASEGSAGTWKGEIMYKMILSGYDDDSYDLNINVKQEKSERKLELNLGRTR